MNLLSRSLASNRESPQASAQQQSKDRKGERKDDSLKRAYAFADLSSYPFKKRLLIRAADLAFYALIGLIGRTTRFEVEGWEHWATASRDGRIPIYNFWHNRVFLATYFWRRRRIVGTP